MEQLVGLGGGGVGGLGDLGEKGEAAGVLGGGDGVVRELVGGLGGVIEFRREA